MGQDDNPDGLKFLREIIEREKAEAYQKYHDDDFSETWARHQAGKSARRSGLKPLTVMLAGVLPVLLVVMIGLGLYLGKKGRPDHSLIDTKTGESLLRNVPLQRRILERRDVLRRQARGLEPDDAASSVEKALQACLGGRKWGGRPQSSELDSPASAPEMIEKENVRARLFAEIIAKLKEI